MSLEVAYSTDLLRQLDTLDTNTTTAPREHYPIAGLQLCLDQGAVHRASRAHDGTGYLIGHTIGDPARVDRRRDDVLLVCTRCDQTSVHALLAIVFPAVVALLAIVADVPEWLDTTAISDRPALHVGADFDDNACTLVACAFGAEC